MPYESDRQRGFFKMCEHNPKHARGKCPPRKTLEAFDRHEGMRRTVNEKLKEKRS